MHQAVQLLMEPGLLEGMTAEAEVGAEGEQGGVPLTAATVRPAYPSPSGLFRTRITTCRPACAAETGPSFAPELPLNVVAHFSQAEVGMRTYVRKRDDLGYLIRGVLE